MKSYKNSETAPPIMQGAPPPPDMRLPMIDWDRPPWNRWAFQRVQEFLPTAPIRRGDTPSELPAAHQDIEGLSYQTHTGGDQDHRQDDGRHLHRWHTDLAQR